MEVSAQDTVIGEFDKLRDALVEGPANWMPGMYKSPTGKITELEADSPFGRLARYARIRVTDAKSGPNEVNGQLRLSRYPDGTNRLELQGDCEPPGASLDTQQTLRR
jgi:hypothetical protein